MPHSSFQRQHAVIGGWWLQGWLRIAILLEFWMVQIYLTCSLTSFVTPGTPSCLHSARNNSPKIAFRGFLIPWSGRRPPYCCRLRVERNHLSTRRALFSGADSSAGATKMDGFSAQYWGNCVVDWVASRKGGAVILERSPLMVEMSWFPVRIKLRYCVDSCKPQ